MSVDIEERLKRILIDNLRMTHLTPEQIGADAPLFGDALGLDSVDALELVMEVERNFGVQIDDSQESRKILYSVRTLADHVAGRLAERG